MPRLDLFSVDKPVIGMLHAPPLPGAPRYAGNLDQVREAVLADARALAEGGVDALLLENFDDAPFYPGRVPAATVAHLAALAVEVRRAFDLPLGINVLRNDGRSALAVAQAAGADFIRVNVLCGARVTDQGVIEGIAHELLRDRRALKAEGIYVLGDVDVKHSAPLAARPLEEEVSDLLHRGGAEGVIVSGSRTGGPADLDKLQRVRAAAGRFPVFVGSGITAENISRYLSLADGFLVGTSLKAEGRVGNPVAVDRVRALVSCVRAGR